MKLPKFDRLLQLANTKAESLAAPRQQLITEHITQAHPSMQPRLSGLQFQINAQKQIAKHPLGICINISNMMTNTFEQVTRLLNQLALKSPNKATRIITPVTSDIPL